jgi:predicted NAD/FAD-binding protein
MPLGSSIWSADPETFLDMPATTLLRFFARHGMLSFGDKPTWRTVTGGAVHYVDAALAGVRSAGRLRLGAPVEALTPADGGVDLTCRGTTERFDHVVVATHSDQALAMLSDPTVDEKEILGSILYQRNDVTLHTDRTLLPRDRRCWASWNYHRPATPSGRVTMTYLLNRLQNLEGTTPVLVTLNRDEAIDPTKVLRRFRYSHPILDGPAVSAQRRHATIDNRRSISFCGAYWRDGFHEDGLQSALTVCRTLGATSW